MKRLFFICILLSALNLKGQVYEGSIVKYSIFLEIVEEYERDSFG